MPQYILDDSGEVEGKAFDELDSFTQGFIECGFFLSEGPGVSTERFLTDEYQEGIQEGTVDGTIPGDVGFSDLQPASLEAMVEFCRDFQEKAADLLEQAYERDYDAEQAGRDLWFTYTGSGVGYWDRKALENQGVWEAAGSPRVGEPGWDEYVKAREDSLGDKLTEACGRGELYLEFAPDLDGEGGTVYFVGY